MSTYNGEKYLRRQLDSIMGQTYPNINILIRDDGSTDGTLDILNEYSEKYNTIKYYQGNNIGVIQSFFELIRNSSEQASYYSFADQDDEWLPEKVEQAVIKIREKQKNRPFLYCSDTYVTDVDLNILKKENKNPRPSFGNSLVQNICTGCTAVMNKKLRNIIKETNPVNIVMHDWWFYMSAELFGETYYDDNAYIKYRQHGNNTFGVKINRRDVWKYRIKQLGEKRGYIYQQLEELSRCYPKMSEESRLQVIRVLKSKRGFLNRANLIFTKGIYRNAKMDDLVYRVIVLIGKL